MLIATKATPPPSAPAATDTLTTLGIAVGWVMVVLGLVLWVLAMVN